MRSKCPAGASTTERFCKVKMEKHLVQPGKMKTTARTLQKSVEAEAKLQEMPERVKGKVVKKMTNLSFRKDE